MASFDSPRVINLLHIGKTGGTALKYALRDSSAHSSLIFRLHNHGVTLMDVPPGEAVIFFLRDPIRRFVSGFCSRQRQGQPRYFAPWSDRERHAFERFSTANELAMSLSAEEVSIKRAGEEAMHEIMHVRDSYWNWFQDENYFRSRLSDILFVGFQESLTRDFLRLKSLLGLPDDVRLPDDDILAHRNPRHLNTALSNLAVDNLRRWYETDYDFICLCKRVLHVDIDLR